MSTGGEEDDDYIEKMSPFLKDIVKEQNEKRGKSKTDKLLERHPSIGESIELLHMFSDDQYFQRNYEEVRHRLKKKINGYKTQVNLLRGQLKRREKSLNEQRATFMKELLVLREELFRKENYPGYQPQDYRFSEGGDYSRIKSGEGVSKKIGGFRKDELELQSDFEEQRKRFFKQKKDILKDITSKNEKVTQTLEKLRSLEEIKLKEVGVLKSREDQVKRMREGLKKKREALNEQMKMLQKKMKQIELERSGKEEQLKVKHLKGIIDRQESRLENLKTEIKSARTQHRYFEEKGARKKIMNKRAELELQEKERLKSELERKKQELEDSVEEKKAEMVRIATEAKIALPGELLAGYKPNVDRDKKEGEESRGEDISEELDNDLLTEDKKEDFFKDLFSKRKKETESEMNQISTEISSFKEEFTSMFQEIEGLQKRMKFYKDDLERKTSLREAKSSKSDINRSESEVLELWKGPEGKMAIVFTDVEGSSKMWDKSCDLMKHCMKVHNRITRKLIRENKGFEVKTEGDAFMIAFPETTSAVRFALTLQSRLMVTNWPTELYRFDCARIQKSEGGTTIFRGMRLRIGIHVGEPIVEDDEVTGRRDYFGPVVIAASRLETFSQHGGHVVISKEVFDGIADIIGNQRKEKKFLGSKVFMKNLGNHKLRGLKEKKEVFVIYPHNVRKRFSLFKSSTVPVVQESLDSKLGTLLSKKMDLEVRREGIEKQMVHQVRIKGMEQEVMEKDGLINYLKKKIEILETRKETEKRMKRSGSSAEKMKEAMEYDNATKMVREDVDEIMDKYYVMMREYRNLKKNFNNVIKLFNTDVKEELGKYEKSINVMKSELKKKIEENMSKEKLWRLKKKEFEINLKKQERIIGKKEDEIAKLQKQIDDLISIPTKFQVLFAGEDEDTKKLLSEQDELSKERLRLKEMRDKIRNEEEEIRNRKIERMKQKEIDKEKRKYGRVRKKQELLAERRRDKLLELARKKATEMSKKSYKELERIRKMKKQESNAILKLKSEAKREIEFMRSRSLTDLAAQSDELERKMMDQERESDELREARRKLESMERKLRRSKRMMKDEDRLVKNIEDRKSEFGNISAELQDLKSQRNKIRLMLEIESEKLSSAKKGDRPHTPEETIRLRKRLEELEKKVLQADTKVVGEDDEDVKDTNEDLGKYTSDDDQTDNNESSEGEEGSRIHTPFRKRTKTPQKKRTPPESEDEEEDEEETLRRIQAQQTRMKEIVELQEALHKKEERMENMLDELKKEREAQEKVVEINTKLREKKEDLKIERMTIERRIDKLVTALGKSKKLQSKLRKERQHLEERVQRFKNKAPPTPPLKTEKKEGEEEEEEGEKDTTTKKEGDDGKPSTPPLSLGSMLSGSHQNPDEAGDEDDNQNRAPSLSEQLVLRNQEVDNQKLIRNLEEEIRRLKDDMEALKEKDGLIEDQIERGEIRKEELSLQSTKKEVEIQELKTLTSTLLTKLRKKQMRVESVGDLKGLTNFVPNYTSTTVNTTTTTSDDEEGVISTTIPSDEEKFYDEEEDVKTDGEEESGAAKITKSTKKLRMISSSHAITLDEKALEEAREKLREQEMELKMRTTDFGKKVEEKMEKKMRNELKTRLENELKRREEELERLRKQQTNMKRQAKLMNMSVFLENAINEAVRLKKSFGQQMNWDEDMIVPKNALGDRFQFTDEDLSEVEKMIKEEEERERKNEVDLDFRRGDESETTTDDEESYSEEGEGEEEGDIEGWQVSPEDDERRKRRRRSKKRRKRKKKKERIGLLEEKPKETSEVEIQTSFPSTPISESFIIPGKNVTWGKLNASMDGQIRDLKSKFELLSQSAMDDVRELYLTSSSSSSPSRRNRNRLLRKRRYDDRKRNNLSETVSSIDEDIEDTRKLRMFQKEKGKEIKRRSKFDHLPSIYEEEQRYLRKISQLVSKKRRKERRDEQQMLSQQNQQLHFSLQKKKKKNRHPHHRVMRGYSRVLETSDISDLKKSFSSSSPSSSNKKRSMNYTSPQITTTKPIVLPRINRLEESIRINRRNKKMKKKIPAKRRSDSASSTTSSVRRLRKFKRWNNMILENEFEQEKDAILDELYYSRNAKLYNHVN